MVLFNIISGIASIIGLVVSLLTLYITSRVRARVDEVKTQFSCRIRLYEIHVQLREALNRFKTAIQKGRESDAAKYAKQIEGDLASLKPLVAEECARVIKEAETNLSNRDLLRSDWKSWAIDCSNQIQLVVRMVEHRIRELYWSSVK